MALSTVLIAIIGGLQRDLKEIAFEAGLRSISLRPAAASGVELDTTAVQGIAASVPCVSDAFLSVSYRVSLDLGGEVEANISAQHPLQASPVIEGRDLLAEDEAASRPVGLVSGASSRVSLGDRVQIGSGMVTIVGRRDNPQRDLAIRIPFSVASELLGPNYAGRVLQVRVADADDEDVCGALTVGYFRSIGVAGRGDPSGFEVRSASEQSHKTEQIILALKSAAVVASLIAVLIAGTGIAGTILSSIQARTREIGVRRAVGATRRQIFLETMADTLVVCASGVTLGVALGAMLCFVLSVVPTGALPRPEFSWFLVLVISILMAAATLGAGLSPALLACNLDPIDALRME